MALTLPYPSLSFVPLDVLTAEEMNEIVANYTYIANQFPIGAANIASNAVTYGKIDWSTIDYTSTETVVGKWADGKTLYRKVYTGTPSLTQNTVSTITLEATGVVDQLVSAKGNWRYYNQDGNQFYAVIGCALNEGAVYSTIMKTNAASLALRLRTAYTIQSAYTVAVEYTKL